jgi:2-polyprenyl-6-hydroxyphenyl methylase/3-demethylubiquinone-9 3-methyltransferase
MKATEDLTLTEVIGRLPAARGYAVTLSRRLDGIERPNRGRRLLEIGAAAGGLTIAFAELGYSSVGLEPNAGALAAARGLADSLNIPCSVVSGCAEAIPFASESFDIVIASSVLEHVNNLELCLSEVSRVLAPGGVFWFQTASSMSPFQGEIGWIPLFGWYPHSLKLRLMKWAVAHCPRLVGHTRTPAIHWFTDQKAKRQLSEVGFGKIWDRWDIRREDEGGKLYASVLQAIRKVRVLRALANVLVSACAYAAIKEGR